jgi:flagellar assembly protein FliH
VAKNVFRSRDVVELGTSVIIEPPKVVEPEIEVVEPLDEYSGPTADDLRREAEAFKEQWEEEKAAMIEKAKEEADEIIRRAEQTAFEEVKKQTDQAQKLRQEAQDESKKLLDDARRQADEERKSLDGQRDEILEGARKEGVAEGREEGYEGGKAEVERLIELLHSIINTAIAKRTEIIEESETQLVNLVLLIAKKVVKVISENQKNVVVNNVIQALRKMKTRGDVAIKVNLADVKLTSEHIKDFMRMVENVRSVTVLEDSTVDPGGCLIETDFGQIDARISSQLHEIEERILELAPIRVKGEQ